MNRRMRRAGLIQVVTATLMESLAISFVLFLSLVLLTTIGSSPYADTSIQIATFTGLTQWALGALPQWALAVTIMMPTIYFAIRVYRRIFPTPPGGQTYLSLSYAESLNLRGTESIVVIVTVAVASLLLGESDTFVIAMVYCVVISVYNLITAYRCKRGFFGTNNIEALELIEYILKNKATLGPPSGGALGQYGSAITIDDTASNLLPEGSKNGR